MGRIFRYEISPLYLKAAIEKMDVPDPEEAWNYFLKIHQPPKKNWKPRVKIPTVQISKLYLNGIVVSLFTILFLYSVFFRGYSGRSEKNDNNLVRKVGVPNKSKFITNTVKKNDVSKTNPTPDLLTEKSHADTALKMNFHTSLVDSTSIKKLNNNESSSGQTVNERISEPSLQNQTSPTVSIPDTINKPVSNMKKKKRNRKKMEEAEILPSSGSDNISLPSGNTGEEEIKLRGE